MFLSVLSNFICPLFCVHLGPPTFHLICGRLYFISAVDDRGCDLDKPRVHGVGDEWLGPPHRDVLRLGDSHYCEGTESDPRIIPFEYTQKHACVQFIGTKKEVFVLIDS